MSEDSQLSQLEQALMAQAETLVREQHENAEAARSRILSEASARVQLAENNLVLAAKAEAERHVRRQVQAMQTRQSAELDRLRWGLTQAVLAQTRSAFDALVRDTPRYQAVLAQWLAAAAAALPPGDLVVEVRAADHARLSADWPAWGEQAAPGRTLTLAAHGLDSVGGCVVRLADARARLDQTFEARQHRLNDELARVIMERLFASAPDLGVLAGST